MKYISFLFLLLTLNSYSSEDALQTTIKAIGETPQVKEIKKEISKQVKPYADQIPKEAIALAKIGIDQEVDFKFKKVNSVNINYREQSIKYQFLYEF